MSLPAGDCLTIPHDHNCLKLQLQCSIFNFSINCTENTTSKNPSIVVSHVCCCRNLFIESLSCLATAVFSGSTILAFSHYVTMHSVVISTMCFNRKTLSVAQHLLLKPCCSSNKIRSEFETTLLFITLSFTLHIQ
jgi:hypothetical protein